MELRNRAAEQALRASEERSGAIINTAYDAFVGMNSEGEIVEWNRQAELTFGWSRDQALGRPLADLLIPPAMRAAHREGLKRFLETGEGPVLRNRIEVTALARDGREFDAELTISPIRLGASWLFGAFLRDITARKLAAAELHQARLAAEAANRAKSEFLANMSHEIRTPMNGVIGMTELALDTDLTPEQREYLSMVKLSAEALLALLNDILDFSKIEAGKLELDPTPFDLGDHLDDTMRSLALRAHAKGLDLAADMMADVPTTVVGDAGRLRQILLNLVGNAIKFTERGEVVVHVSVESRAELEAWIHFAVSDSGIGIASEKLPQLFQPFTQADSSTTRKHGGTGLGLAIARQLTSLMGGGIWVESVVGQGSTFHFTARLGLQSGAERRRPAAGVELSGLPVLVVDDNGTNRRILCELLQRWGLAPTAVEGGAAALGAMRAAAENDQPYRLAFVDCMMPDMDGFSLAQRIRDDPALRKTTLMMISSAVQAEYRAQSRAAGFAAYLTKPLKQSELFDTILGNLRGAAPAESLAVVHATELRASRPRRILLAEDSLVNQRLAMGLLKSWGHSVTVASNGREAIDAIEAAAASHDGEFDLVLMDVQMPELDGIEATALVRQREQATGGHLPIVAMTAHAMKGDRESCLEAGMDAYLSKPIRARELFDTVERHFAEPTLHGEHAHESPAREETAPRASHSAATPPDDGPVGPRDSAPRDSDVFDLDAAIRNAGGDTHTLAELARLFIEDAARILPALDEALRQGDGASVRREAQHVARRSPGIRRSAARGRRLAARGDRSIGRSFPSPGAAGRGAKRSRTAHRGHSPARRKKGVKIAGGIDSLGRLARRPERRQASFRPRRPLGDRGHAIWRALRPPAAAGTTARSRPPP